MKRDNEHLPSGKVDLQSFDEGGRLAKEHWYVEHAEGRARVGVRFPGLTQERLLAVAASRPGNCQAEA